MPLTIGLVHDSPTPSAEDAAFATELENRGHTVTEIVETDTPPTSGYDVLIISESGSSGTVAPYDTNPLPVLCFETPWNSLRMSSAGASSSSSGGSWDLQTHDITTGLADPLTVHGNSSRYGVATSSLPAGVEVVAVNPTATTHALLIVADAGATLTSGTAPARRGCAGLLNSRVGTLTAAGYDLIENTLEWLAGGGAHEVNVGQASETDTALAVVGPKNIAVGQVTETGTAQVVTPTGPVSYPVQMTGSHVSCESHSYVAPVVDTNGNIYMVTESILSENNQPRMMKSSDGGATWTEQDAANRPGTDTGSIADLESGWLTYESGGFITFTWQRSYAAYSRFRASDHPTNPDTWVSNTRENIEGVSGSPQYMSHTSPTDQSYQWLFYGNGTASNYRSRTNSSTYGSSNSLAAAAVGPAAWLDADNISHILYSNNASSLRYKTLTSAGVLSSEQTIGATHSVALPHTRPCIYTNGGTKIVTCLYINSSAALQAVDVTGGVVGSPVAVGSGTVLTDPATTGNQGAVISADCDVANETVHAVWSEGTTLYHSSRPHGGSWSSPATLASGYASDIMWTYCRVVEFPSGERHLAVHYAVGHYTGSDDTSDMYYTRVVLPAAGKNIAVGQATETDSLQALGKSKSKSVGLNAGTDAAQASGKSKSKTAGLNSETDTAQAATSSKRRALGLNTETDLAQPVTANKQRAVGLTTETDLAQPIEARPLISVNLGQASETDAAQAVGKTKNKATGQTSETDTAQAVSTRRGFPVGLASEANQAQGVSASVSVTLGLAEETDQARQVVRSLMLAHETDAALSIAPSFDRVIHVGVAEETNLAQPISREVGVAVDQAAESDSSLVVSKAKQKEIGLVTETDEAFEITASVIHFKSVGQAAELGIALSVTVSLPIYLFTPPTFTRVVTPPPLVRQPRYNLTESISLVRIDGVLTEVHSPTARQLTQAGSEGEDWFLGGRRYEVNQAVSDELVAAGYSTERL